MTARAASNELRPRDTRDVPHGALEVAGVHPLVCRELLRTARKLAKVVERHTALPQPGRGLGIQRRKPIKTRDRFAEPAPRKVFFGPVDDGLRVLRPDRHRSSHTYHTGQTDQPAAQAERELRGHGLELTPPPRSGDVDACNFSGRRGF